MLNLEKNRRPVIIDYTNYKGVRAIRRILPVRMDYGLSQWHKEGYYIVAIDLEKDEIRTFAIRDIHSWKESSEEPRT